MVKLYYDEFVTGGYYVGTFPLDFETDGYYYVRGFTVYSESNMDRTIAKFKTLTEATNKALSLIKNGPYEDLLICVKRAKPKIRWYHPWNVPAKSLYNQIGTVSSYDGVRMVTPNPRKP